MSYEAEGKLHKKYETEQKSDTFKTREFVLLQDQTQYPNYVKFQLTQDKTDLLNDIPEGTTIKVYFDLRGRVWQGKYFTNLTAWRIETIGATSQPSGGDQTFPPPPPADFDGHVEDDLPF